jgi:dephospho-CoA kinase
VTFRKSRGPRGGGARPPPHQSAGRRLGTRDAKTPEGGRFAAAAVVTSDKASRGPVAVAITGGIGAGKSEALRAFARHGAATVSADEIVHRLYDDQDVKRTLVERFGGSVLDDDGEVDRRRVGEIVFGDRDELEWLEALLHPRVVAAQAHWREELATQPDPPEVVVVEVPLLYETGGERRFDAVVLITAPNDVRKERTAVANTEERAKRLIPDEEKVGRADFAYVNDGTLEQLDAFVADVLAKLERRR